MSGRTMLTLFAPVTDPLLDVVVAISIVSCGGVVGGGKVVAVPVVVVGGGDGGRGGGFIGGEDASGGLYTLWLECMKPEDVIPP